MKNFPKRELYFVLNAGLCSLGLMMVFYFIVKVAAIKF